MTYPPHHHRSQRGYRTLTIAVFPLAIYVFQLLSRVSFAATCATGVLVALKALVEWGHHRPHCPQPRQRRPRTTVLLAPPLPATTALSVPLPPPVPRMSTTIVCPVQIPPPTGVCFLCQKRSAKRVYWLPARRRTGICEQCWDWVAFSRCHA